MALLPSPFCNRLFKLLEDNGFIDRTIHLPVFWDTAAVCISSNDSALSIQGSAEVVMNSEPFQVVDSSDCWRLENAPPFWGLDEERVSWVKVSADPEMWGEIGPRRKAISLNGKHELSSVVERTLIMKTSEGLTLIFPSLHGTKRCLAKQEAGSRSWQVCVNPVSELFEERNGMQLVKTEPTRSIQNGKCLDFGWRNFQLEDHEKISKQVVQAALVTLTRLCEHKELIAITDEKFNKAYFPAQIGSPWSTNNGLPPMNGEMLLKKWLMWPHQLALNQGQ
jgi:hypothetical protein